jgi:hypothetical protein
MNNTNIISGKEFKEAIKVGNKFHSIEYCLDKKKELNAANYIGFSTLKFGKNSFIVYTMKLNINDIIINENNISGFFIHSIYDVILDECDKHNKEYLSYGNKNKNKINIICKEYFEGIWFAKENRMLIYGTLLECVDKEVPIGKENYDIYITDNYIIGKWAFRKATKERDGIIVPDIILGDNDVFTEHIYMFKVNESTLCFSPNILRNNIIDYLNILKNTNHSYSINDKLWVQTDISHLLNNYNDISIIHEDIKNKIKNIYYETFSDKIILDIANINDLIDHNDIIYFDNIYFIPDTSSSTIIGNVWKRISEDNIFIGKNMHDTNPGFVNHANSLLNCINNCCADFKISDTIIEHFNVKNIKEHDYMSIKDNNEYKYFKPKINEENIVVTIDITSITNIKQLEQKFECVFRIKVEWLPSIADLYYILSYGKANYIPSWKPLNVLFLNKYEVKSEKQEGPFLYKSNDKYKNVIYYYYNISFIDKVELNNFPFDIQDLEIEIEIPKCDKNDIEWILNKNENIINHLSEWNYMIVQHSPHNNPVKKYKRIIHIFVKRNYWVYVWRIIFVMSLISLVSFFNISIDPFDNLGERVTYSVTLFLTSIAYSIVTTTYLPILGNQTLMDWYIFHVYIYLGSNMGVISLIPYYNPEIVEKYDVIIHYIYLGIWFIWHMAFIIRVKYFILPYENKKIDKYNVIEFFCNHCGICGLYWKKINKCELNNASVIYKNILLENEIKNLYDKLNANIIILKECRLNELLLNSKAIKRNSFIQIGDNLFFKPICGTRNQIYINASKKYEHICYECGKISNGINKYDIMPGCNNNYNI